MNVADGGGSFDIAVRSELFTKVSEVESSFNTDFEESYKKMKDLYEKMSTDKDFKGEARDGFIELFHILLQFHEDLKNIMPDLFKEFDYFSESLDEIKSTGVYKELY